MKLSFVIPCYNEEALIGSCIDSIKAEIFRFGQLEDYEIIVVDNMSTDNTKAIAESLEVRVVEETQQSVTFARSRGAKEAQFDLIAYIDADNVVPPGWLNHLRTIEIDEVVCVSGPFIYLNSPKWVVKGSKFFYWLGSLLHQHFAPMVQGGNFVVVKDIMLAVLDEYTKTEFFGEDAILAILLSDYGDVIFDKEMKIFSSNRRLEGDGVIRTTYNYAINYIWANVFHKPYTLNHRNYRN